MDRANSATVKKHLTTPADLLIVVIFFILLFAGQNMAYGASTPTIGHFQLHDSNGTVTEALLQKTHFQVQVEGNLARVEVEQVFHNASNLWVEGEYVFPLSTTGAVDYMEMTIGNRRIVGSIKEKEIAKQIYNQAKQAGKKASLVSQQRPNLFTNRVANIAPGETIQVKLRYIDIVKYDQGQFSLRFPTTLTPRYEPPDQSYRFTTTNHEEESPQPPMKMSALAAPLTLIANINVGVDLDSLKSLYHPAFVQRDTGGYILQLEPGAKLNRDIVLEWQPMLGSEPLATAFKQIIGNDQYLFLMLLPPQSLQTAFILPKETIFVIDTSGSMGGVAIEQARQSLLSGLTKLSASDRFNIIEFNSTARALWEHAVPVTPENINNGITFVNSLNANGGTEMASALRTAFKHSAPSGFVRQVIFITDGSVGNEAALFELIHRQRGSSRLFTVGIGSAPNSHFMEKSAEAGQGSFTYIGSQEDIQDKMTGLFNKLQYPVLTDIALKFNSNTALEIFPVKTPDLYAGEPLVLTGKVSGNFPQLLSIVGKRGSVPFDQQIRLNNIETSTDIHKLWARRKLSALYDVENQARFNGDEDMAAAFKGEITQLALDHQIMSKYTSFIAVEEKISRSFNEYLSKLVVANAMPAGNTMAVPVPRGGIGIGQLWLISLISLLVLAGLVIFTLNTKTAPNRLCQ